MGKSVKLFDYIERKKKAGSVTVDLGKEHGKVDIPPVEVWPDEVFDTAGSGNTKGAVALLLGQDAADRFHAAGGNYRLLSGIVTDRAGLSVGESEASPES